MSPHIRIRGQLGTTSTTAQVNPEAFTRSMMRAAQAKGAHLRIGGLTGLLRMRDRVVGVQIGDVVLAGDALSSPWVRGRFWHSGWLSLPPVFGRKGHSVVLATGDLPPEALFLEMEDDTGAHVSPEVFPRPDGTTWVRAISSEGPLPLSPTDVEPDPGAMDRLKRLCARISPALGDARIIAKQACVRPIAEDGLPLIGAVPGAPGAYVATGHSVWGILNAPATGEAVTELILEGDRRGSIYAASLRGGCDRSILLDFDELGYSTRLSVTASGRHVSWRPPSRSQPVLTAPMRGPYASRA